MSEHMGGGGSGRILFSLLMGIFLLVFGAAASLASFSISSPVPTGFLSPTVVKILLMVSGLLILIDSFKVRTMMGAVKGTTVIISIIMALAGALPLLIDYKLVGFLPFLMSLDIPVIALSIMLAVYGLYLLIVSIGMYRSHAMGFA